MERHPCAPPVSQLPECGRSLQDLIRLRRLRRWHGARTLADHRHHRITIFDVIVEQLQCGVGVVFLAEIGLHPHDQSARPQIARHQFAGGGEFAAGGGKEYTESLHMVMLMEWLRARKRKLGRHERWIAALRSR